MESRQIEPRTALWAVAEIIWTDAAGNRIEASATLEDTSRSGACLRLKSPVRIGSRLTVKWRREQFSAVAKNCRADGREYLLGVSREPDAKAEVPQAPAKTDPATGPQVPGPAPQVPAQACVERPSPPKNLPDRGSPRQERTAMESGKMFSKFWRHQPGQDAPSTSTPSEAPVHKPDAASSESAKPVHNELLSYKDIYHAAGILAPPSGYGIEKVVDMLNSERIRDLSKDIKRASVLMALDAAGSSVDDVLQDATRRQRALESYEAAQRRQLEEFEARKSRENAQIEAELEQLRAHYAERIRKNRDQVELEKENLRNWQSAMQCETQRITEVIELCRKQTPGTSLAVSDSPQHSADSKSVESARSATAGPR